MTPGVGFEPTRRKASAGNPKPNLLPQNRHKIKHSSLQTKISRKKAEKTRSGSLLIRP